MWHIQYWSDGADCLERYPSPERAIEAACHLIHVGKDVYAIGSGPLTDSIGPAEIARIYGIWHAALPIQVTLEAPPPPTMPLSLQFGDYVFDISTVFR